MEVKYREVKRSRVASDAGADSCVSNQDSALQLGLEVAPATVVTVPAAPPRARGWKRCFFCRRECSNEERDRMNYVRKVYLILFAQLGITMIWVGISMSSASLQSFIYTRLWLFLIALCVLLVILTVLSCAPKLIHRVPWNYGILFLFVRTKQTLATAYMVSYVTARLNAETVIAAGGMTGAVFLSLTLYVWFAPVFSRKIASICGLVGSLLALVVIYVLLTQNALVVCFCFIVSAIISFYLVFAISAIVSRDGMPLDNYIAGALMLYTVRDR